MFGDVLTDLYNLAYGLIVDIPVDNVLGILYVVANTLVSVLLSLFGYDSSNGIFSGF